MCCVKIFVCGGNTCSTRHIFSQVGKSNEIKWCQEAAGLGSALGAYEKLLTFNGGDQPLRVWNFFLCGELLLLPFQSSFSLPPMKTRERNSPSAAAATPKQEKELFTHISGLRGERLSNGFSVHYYIATGQSSHYQRPFHDLQLIYWRTRGRHRLKNAITCFSAFSREASRVA